MGIRKGSIVTVIAAEQSGVGSADSVITGAEVVDTNGHFLAVIVGSQTKVYPWASIRRVEVTTY